MIYIFYHYLYTLSSIIHHYANCSRSYKAWITYSFANLKRSKLNYDIAFSSLLLAYICICILSNEITLVGLGRGALKTDAFIFYYIGLGGGGGGITWDYWGLFLIYFIISINLFLAKTLLLFCC